MKKLISMVGLVILLSSCTSWYKTGSYDYHHRVLSAYGQEWQLVQNVKTKKYFNFDGGEAYPTYRQLTLKNLTTGENIDLSDRILFEQKDGNYKPVEHLEVISVLVFPTLDNGLIMNINLSRTAPANLDPDHYDLTDCPVWVAGERIGNTNRFKANKLLTLRSYAYDASAFNNNGFRGHFDPKTKAFYIDSYYVQSTDKVNENLCGNV